MCVQRCIEVGGALRGVLTVVAPARAGSLRGALTLWAQAPRAPAPPAATRRAVSLSALPGRVAALPLALVRAAPYAGAEAPLVLESSMAPRMRVLAVTLPPHERALSWAAPAHAPELGAGRTAVGALHYRPERLCEPDCYTGLDITSTGTDCTTHYGYLYDFVTTRNRCLSDYHHFLEICLVNAIKSKTNHA